MPALFTSSRRSDGSSIDDGSSTSRRCTVIEPAVVADLVDEPLAGLRVAHGRDDVEAGAGEVDGDGRARCHDSHR